MNPDEPTHFNVLVVGTGLHESITAAALSNSGYSVLQLDPAPYYGTQHASLSLSELVAWAANHPSASSSPSSPPEHLLKQSQRFALSLAPLLLRAQGPALDLLVRSKVAAYLQFGLLNGVGLVNPQEGRVDRVPASKADVFNDQRLSLVEKRRLTKLLLFAAGQDRLEEDKVLAADPDLPFVDYLSKAFSLSGPAASSLTYALALCSSPSDPALPALARLRSIIHSVGRYGPSPYLVGHYGGAGDLVGGFSRICAIWGGGQILGRPVGALERTPEVGRSVDPGASPFAMGQEKAPPAPAAPAPSKENQEGREEATTRPLGIPVELEPGQKTTFTGDWVLSSPYLLSTLFPSSSASDSPASSSQPTSAHLIAILPSPVSFPPPREPRGPDEGDEPDSNLFVFLPGSLGEKEGEEGARVGTVTALQVGKGTMSCPDGYHILYLSAPLLVPFSPSEQPDAAALLQPYLDALLALPPASPPPPSSSTDDPAPPPTAISPLYTVFYVSSAPPPPPSAPNLELPANLLVLPSPPSLSRASALIDTLDELVPLCEETFWTVVGEEGRREGVEFFAREKREEEDDAGGEE
ncbi:hypothetical protein JCM8097_004348 [Rhodosporidiobolus ruineniae]